MNSQGVLGFEEFRMSVNTSGTDESGTNNISLSDDIIPDSPLVKRPSKSKKLRKPWVCNGDSFIPPAESEVLMNLKNPVCPVPTNVFVFHTCREILMYNARRYPVNNYVRIIGIFKTSPCNVPFIQDLEVNVKKFTAFLNLKTIGIMPKLNEVIEIFGRLEFQQILGKDIPIIMVQFFNYIEGNIMKYIHYLKIQKRFIPESCLKMNKEIEKVEDSLIDLLQDLSFSILSIEKE